MAAVNFNNLWDAYPKNLLAKEVYELVGGEAWDLYQSDPIMYANACALRMSEACNKGGMIIHSGSDVDTGYRVKGKILDYETLPGRNYYAYYVRVQDMITFFEKRLGRPSNKFTLFTRPSVRAVDGRNFQNRQGVMVFKIPFSDATGHVALWNGSNFADGSNDDYFKHSNLTEILFWEL